MRPRPSPHLRRLLLRTLRTAQYRQHRVRIPTRRQRAQLLRRHLAAQQAHHVATRAEKARHPAQRAVRQLAQSALLLLQRRRHMLHHARRCHHLLLFLFLLLALARLLALLHSSFDLVAHGDDLGVEVLAEEDARAEQQQARVVGLQQAVRALQQQRGGALGGGVAAGKATARAYERRMNSAALSGREDARQHISAS